MIDISEKNMCCGCAACVGICPKDCIKMKEDEEGFQYPSIDKSKCIECGACEKVCPVLNYAEKKPFEQKGYVVQHKNPSVLRESTSGGAFTAIAKYTLNRGGVVFGIELTDDLTAKRTYIEKESELYRFRSSKYVQNCEEGVHRQVKAFLKEGRCVCFSGTPCQTEGLRNYLGKDYENLILVDVVCHAVQSPLIFRKYIEYQEQKTGSKVKTVKFRDKHYGYKYSTLNLITDKNQGSYHQGVESDPWLRAFFSNICDRPSCHNCRFRSRYRKSDITIWDCFNAGRFSKELDNDKGATRVLIHTKKGETVFNEVCSELNYAEADPEALVSTVKEMKESPKPNERRTAFFQDAGSLDSRELFEKYFPKTLKVRAEHAVRLTCYKLGIYSVMKKLFVKITHKY